MQKISPFLWFVDNAEEAVAFYTSVFKDAKVKQTLPGPDGKPMSFVFELLGNEFMALNGGRHDDAQAFNMGVSFFIKCEDQAEVDYYWEKLSAGGGATNCGWVKDKFGLWWQVIPNNLMRYMADKDPQKVARVMECMLKMDKMIVKDLDDAYKG